MGKIFHLSSLTRNRRLKETFESELLGGVTTIRFTGKKLNMDTWQDGALYDTREQVFEDIELKSNSISLLG